MEKTYDIIERVNDLCAARHNQPSALIEILHDVQETFGHVPPDGLPTIAEALNLSRAEVYGVLTFYHDFRTEPAAQPVVKLCRAEACQSMGSEALAQALADAPAEIRTVYCLGNCALAPAAMVGERLIGRANKARICQAVDEVADG